MSTVGPLEGITSAIGQQLTELGGLRSTRVEAGFPAAKGDLFIQVETTHGWETSGSFYADGILHKYTGVAPGIYPAQLLGITYFDDESFLPGVGIDLAVLTEIVDYSRVFSAVEQMRRTFLVDFALSSDLDTLGRNIGVFREPELVTSDDIFRNIIKATAYSPRATMYTIELFLTALFGAGNYVVFEDMTNGGYTSRLAPPTTVNNPGQIFVTNKLVAPTSSAGQTYIEAPIRGAINPVGVGLSTSVLRFGAYYPYNHVAKIQGARLKDEGGLRIVADPVRHLALKGSAVGVIPPGESEINCTFIQVGSDNLLDYLQVGDYFATATDSVGGRYPGVNGPEDIKVIGVVKSVTPVPGGGTFDIGPDQNVTNPTDTPFLPGVSDFSTNTWVVFREKTLCDAYFPSGDFATEGMPTEASLPSLPTRVWTFDNNGTGTVEAAPNVTRDIGRGTILLGKISGDDVAYRQEARILPDSDASFEAQLTFGSDPDIGVIDQFIMEMVDGDPIYGIAGKHIRLGMERDPGVPGAPGLPNVYVGFSDAVNSFISGAALFRVVGGTEHIFRLEKRGQNRVYFYVDNQLIDSIDYSSLTTAVKVDQYRSIGVFGTNAPALGWLASVRIGYLDWSSHNPTDLTNIRILDGEAVAGTSDILDNGGIALLGGAPIGARVSITNPTVRLDDYPGNVRGEFEVEAVVSPNRLTIRGYRQEGNAIIRDYALGIGVARSQVLAGETQRNTDGVPSNDDPYAFTFPDDIGKLIRVYTGSGPVYEERTIIKILDPLDGSSIGPLFGIDESVMPYNLTTLPLASLPRVSSNLCEVDSDWTNTYENAEWSLEPVFPAAGDSGIKFEVVQQSAYAGVAGTATSLLTMPVSYTKPTAYIGDGELHVVAIRSHTESAQIIDPDNRNDLTLPPAYDYYPFYLTGGQIGSAKNTLQRVLTAAGVHVNLKPFVVNDAGEHIL